jgi:hypothetical protein
MKLIALIIGLFSKSKNGPSAIAEAVSEGIKDTFKEMGYYFNETTKRYKV